MVWQLDHRKEKFKDIEPQIQISWPAPESPLNLTDLADEVARVFGSFM